MSDNSTAVFDGDGGGCYGGTDNGAFMAGDVSAGFGGMDPYMAGGGQGYYPGGGPDFSGISYTLGSGVNSLGGGGVYHISSENNEGYAFSGESGDTVLEMDEVETAGDGEGLEDENAGKDDEEVEEDEEEEEEEEEDKEAEEKQKKLKIKKAKGLKEDKLSKAKKSKSKSASSPKNGAKPGQIKTSAPVNHTVHVQTSAPIRTEVKKAAPMFKPYHTDLPQPRSPQYVRAVTSRRSSSFYNSVSTSSEKSPLSEKVVYEYFHT